MPRPHFRGSAPLLQATSRAPLRIASSSLAHRVNTSLLRSTRTSMPLVGHAHRDTTHRRGKLPCWNSTMLRSYSRYFPVCATRLRFAGRYDGRHEKTSCLSCGAGFFQPSANMYASQDSNDISCRVSTNPDNHIHSTCHLCHPTYQEAFNFQQGAPLNAVLQLSFGATFSLLASIKKSRTACLCVVR
jgi:hypothetical protein